jgi:hypothetical protein
VFKYDVVEVDPGCDCCSYLTVRSFDTMEEAEEFVGNDKNLIIEPDYWMDEDE